MSVKDSESGEGSSKDIKTGYTCTVNDKLKQKKLDLFLDPTVGAIACGVYQFDDNLITWHTSESESVKVGECGTKSAKSNFNATGPKFGELC